MIYHINLQNKADAVGLPYVEPPIQLTSATSTAPLRAS